MHDIIELVKASWNVKREIKKCLKRPEDSQEHVLAQHYKTYLKGLENEELTPGQIDILEKDAIEKQKANEGNQHVQELLSSVLGFSQAIKNVDK